MPSIKRVRFEIPKAGKKTSKGVRRSRAVRLKGYISALSSVNPGAEKKDCCKQGLCSSVPGTDVTTPTAVEVSSAHLASTNSTGSAAAISGEKEKKKPKKRGRPAIAVAHDNKFFKGDPYEESYLRLGPAVQTHRFTQVVDQAKEVLKHLVNHDRSDLMALVTASVVYRQGVPFGGYEVFYFHGLRDVRPLNAEMQEYLKFEVSYMTGNCLRDLVGNVLTRFLGEDLRVLIRWVGQETSKTLSTSPNVRNRNICYGIHLPVGVCEGFESVILARWVELGCPGPKEEGKDLPTVVRKAFQKNLADFVWNRLKYMGVKGLFDVYNRLFVSCGDNEQRLELEKMRDNEKEYQKKLSELKKKDDAKTKET